MAGAESAGHARHVLSVAREVRVAPLRLRARDADRVVDAAAWVYGCEGSPLVDDRARHSVLAPHRTSAADRSSDNRTQPARSAGAHEHSAAVAAARRTASLLQRR